LLFLIELPLSWTKNGNVEPLCEQCLEIELPSTEVTNIRANKASDSLLAANDRDFVVRGSRPSDRQNVEELVCKFVANRHHRRSHHFI
jgi:hypothetical protein